MSELDGRTGSALVAVLLVALLVGACTTSPPPPPGPTTTAARPSADASASPTPPSTPGPPEPVQSVTVTPAVPPIARADLARTVRSQPKSTDPANVHDFTSFAPPLNSACTRRLGLSEATIASAKRVVYLVCQEEPLDTRSAPARVLAQSVSLDELVSLVSLGPTDAERAAGFSGFSDRELLAQVGIVDGYAVIDYLVPPAGPRMSSLAVPPIDAMSVARATGLTKVAMLVQHQPMCLVGGLC